LWHGQHARLLTCHDGGSRPACLLAAAAFQQGLDVLEKERLKPAAPVDMKRTLELIKQLDAEEFKARESANKELLKFDEQILPVLDKALAAQPTLETKRRLEALRGRLTSVVLQGERLRAYRAIEVLERIGTPEALQVLQELAKGAPGALITTSAKAVVKRGFPQDKK